MGYGNEKRQHYGPEPHYGMGAEMVHHMIHERAIGKTIAAVYLGDAERFRSLSPENSPPDGIFRSEYLAFEFTDGTSLVVEVAAGNSFHVADTREAPKVLKSAKDAAHRRLRAQP
jgi:hypothetical protein